MVKLNEYGVGHIAMFLLTEGLDPSDSTDQQDVVRCPARRHLSAANTLIRIIPLVSPSPEQRLGGGSRGARSRHKAALRVATAGSEYRG